MMAALISGGVNALQGKRGSDLLKSTIKDTAIAAVLGGAKVIRMLHVFSGLID